MQFDFEQTMKAISDIELLKITSIDKNNYQEAAVLAAERELKKRNISIEKIDTLNKINLINTELTVKKAETPLELPHKLLAFVLPGIHTLILSGYLKGNGYEKKSKDLTTWTLYGFGFYIIIIILLNTF